MSSLHYYPAIEGCRLVDAYEIHQRLGEGSYGIVYRAIDKVNRQEYALKQMKLTEHDADNGLPLSVLREILLLIRCQQHENVVNVREIVTNEQLDKIYIAMDYMPYTLNDVIKRKAERKEYFTCKQLKSYLWKLLNGLNYLHDNWIIHRDIKPANILVNYSGDVLKFADFGIARSFGQPAMGEYTNNVTSLWYRAPELLFGATTYDTAVDIWSLGCIFGELILLRTMFSGLTELQQIHCIFRMLGTPTREIWPEYECLPACKHFLCLKAFNACDSNLEHVMGHRTTQKGLDLLKRMLCYSPMQRIRTLDSIKHGYFQNTAGYTSACSSGLYHL